MKPLKKSCPYSEIGNLILFPTYPTRPCPIEQSAPLDRARPTCSRSLQTLDTSNNADASVVMGVRRNAQAALTMRGRTGSYVTAAARTAFLPSFAITARFVFIPPNPPPKQRPVTETTSYHLLPKICLRWGNPVFLFSSGDSLAGHHPRWSRCGHGADLCTSCTFPRQVQHNWLKTEFEPIDRSEASCLHVKNVRGRVKIVWRRAPFFEASLWRESAHS